MDERGVSLVLGAIEVHVRADAGVVAAGVLHERGHGVEERVQVPFELAHASPHALVRRLAIEAALLPDFIAGRVVPRLDVHMAGDDEGDDGQLPVAGLAMATPVLLQIALIAQVVPDPALTLEQPHDVHAAAQRVIAGEAGSAGKAVGWLKAKRRQGLPPTSGQNRL